MTSLSLHTNTSLLDAMALPVSLASDALASKAFTDHIKNKEVEVKIQNSIGERINTVVKAIGELTKAIGKKRMM